MLKMVVIRRALRRHPQRESPPQRRIARRFRHITDLRLERRHDVGHFLRAQVSALGDEERPKRRDGTPEPR